MAKASTTQNTEPTVTDTKKTKAENYFYKAVLDDTFMLCYYIEGLGTTDAIHLASIMVAQGLEVNTVQDVKDKHKVWLGADKWDRVSEERFDSLWTIRKPKLLKDLINQKKFEESGKTGGLKKAENASKQSHTTPESTPTAPEAPTAPTAPKTAPTAPEAPTAQTALKTAFKPNVDLEDYSDEVAKVAKLFNEIYCLPGMGSRTITVADMNKIDHALSWDVEAADFMQSLQIHKLAIVGAKEKDQDSKKLWIPGIEKYIDDQRYDIKTTADRINWKTILQARQRECEEFS